MITLVGEADICSLNGVRLKLLFMNYLRCDWFVTS